MNHQDHVLLIQNGIKQKGGVWADLGSGEGAFTLALRDLGGESMGIYSVDKDAYSLERQKANFAAMFPQSNTHFITSDFTKELHLPKLDGIIMANAIHYVKNKEEFLQKISTYLKQHGLFVLVEYNASFGNSWVPYPLPFDAFASLAEKTGFEKPMLLETIPSRFLNEIYSAVTYKKG